MNTQVENFDFSTLFEIKVDDSKTDEVIENNLCIKSSVKAERKTKSKYMVDSERKLLNRAQNHWKYGFGM